MTTKCTICHYENIKEAQATLHEIGLELQTLLKLEEMELEYQKKQAKKLWTLAQKYRILDRGAPGVSLYPDFAVEQVICEMMNEMSTLVRSIRESNQKIEEYIDTLRPIYEKLDKTVKKIDWTTDCGMIAGDEIFKPLYYYIETVADLRKSFKKNAIERSVVEQMLDIQYCVTVEAYEALLRRPASHKTDFAKAICFCTLIYPVC